MSKQIERRRILVIDDSDAIHGDFRKTLERKSPTEKLAAAAAVLFGDDLPSVDGIPAFEVESAMQGEEGFHKVETAVGEQRPYALAFVDMRMPPGWDGVETVEQLWKADPELQIVICTAYSDYSWDAIVNRLGTSDRLLILKKPFDPIEVCQLATALSEKWKLKRQAVLKLEQLEKMVHERTLELRRLAHTDKLTGLPNRACFNELLKQTGVYAPSSDDSRFAIFFLDFDRFKFVNDNLGHDVGDQLLSGIADRLRLLLNQKSDTELSAAPCIAARLGGDEFVILQRNIKSDQDAVCLADQLLASLSAPYVAGTHEIHSSASIGIACSSASPTNAIDLLRNADNAMYRAKSQGKAQYVLFTPEMGDQIVARITLENDLCSALEKGQLTICYQPRVSLGAAKLVGFETLLRWNHPERGPIPPDEFIPIAEETGLLLPIGHWVIQQATRQLAEWNAHHPDAGELNISVNCSWKQLADPQLKNVITAALQNAGLSPSRLSIEITESAVMSQPAESRRILQGLRDLGITLEMDDFGTGYSSLNCLHALPLDVLKIDRSFIQNLSQRRDYAAIINAIIALAHNLNMTVTAEGVESADHAAMLSALECDHAQGFFFSKPLSVDSVEEYLARIQTTAAATA